MVFFATVLVFIISILTYSLYPRNDQYNLNLTKAEASVLAFVNQHQAAKDYMVQMLQVSTGSNNDITDLPEDIENMMPIGSFHEICLNTENPIDNNCYESIIACYNENTTNASGNSVTNTDTLTSDCINADHQYVITYGLAPNWWPDDVWHQETWRKAILKRTRGSASCGVLVDVITDNLVDVITNNNTQYYGIDTSQTITGPTTYSFTSNNNPVPVKKRALPLPISKKFIGDQATPGLLWNVYKNYDILFCISPFQNPYIQDDLVFHWDKINNNKTQHTQGATTPLVGSWDNGTQGQINISKSSPLTISGVIIPTTTGNSFLSSNGKPFIIAQRFTGANSNNQPIDESYIKIGKTCTQVPNRTFSFTYVLNTSNSTEDVYINGQKKGNITNCPITNTTLTSINLSGVTLANSLNNIANFKIYSTDLGADDILQNYKADRKRFGIIP